MTTSDSTSFPQRLTKIDELSRGDHTYLDKIDECLFFGEYTARKGFAHSVTNNLILNFKKPLKHKGKPSWFYKAKAINEVSQAFSQNLGTALGAITLVPIPPSKIKTDPEYDDRLMEMLRGVQAPQGIKPDIRELIAQTKSMPPSHESENRLPPAEWEKSYQVDEKLSTPPPAWIGILDDLLVTGCRFRAMSGGIESTCLAWMLRPELGFTVDYGQVTAQTEISSAKDICHFLNIDHAVLRAPTEFVRIGLLAGNEGSTSIHPEFWPYRNQFILTCAMMAAYDRGVTEIQIGSVVGDSRFADGTTGFIDLMNDLAKLQGSELIVSAPAIKMTTEQLLSIANPPAQLLGLTFSCHRANIPCGDCPGCNKNRQVLAAFYN